MSSSVFKSHSDGKWYFWDETWSEAYGPYDTKEAAEIAFKKYCEWYL